LSGFGKIDEHLDALQYSKSRFYGMVFGAVVLAYALKKKPGENPQTVS